MSRVPDHFSNKKAEIARDQAKGQVSFITSISGYVNTPWMGTLSFISMKSMSMPMSSRDLCVFEARDRSGS
jgi:hypothetical protein